MKRLCAVVAVLLALPALAQQSASYKISDHTLDSGGMPPDGVVLSSTSYRITLAALGDSLSVPSLASASYAMDLEFVPRYPPPGEARDLAFTAWDTLTWSPERSGGGYNLYRGAIGDLSGLGYGACFQPDLPGYTTTDGDVPLPGGAYFYLITAENRLAEAGTKGQDGAGSERGGTPCP